MNIARFVSLSTRISLLSLLTSVLSTGVIAEESSVDTAASAAPVATQSQYSCSLQGLTRRVVIDYPAANGDAVVADGQAIEPAKVPCDVNYYKDSEAPDQVTTLWSAQNLEGYCEQKASEFVSKLQSWGWSCE